MKTISQNQIAKRVGISAAYMSLLVNTIKRPSWKRAKQIANITKTSPILWLDGSSEEIKAALAKNTSKESQTCTTEMK